MSDFIVHSASVAANAVNEDGHLVTPIGGGLLVVVIDGHGGPQVKDFRFSPTACSSSPTCTWTA